MKNDSIYIVIALFAIKLLYMLTVDYMLPETYSILSFNKEINWSLIAYEIPAFLLGAYLFLLSYKRNPVVDFFLVILFVMTFIPVNSGLVLSNNDVVYYVLNNCYSISILAVFAYFTRKNPSFDCIVRSEDLVLSRRNWRIISIFMIIASLVVIGYVYYQNGINISIIFVSEMYDVRADYTDYVQENTGGFISYFVVLLGGITKWLLPIYFYFSIRKGAILSILLSLFSFIAIFSLSMEKSTLFFILIPFFVSIVVKKMIFKNIARYLVNCFLVLFGGSLLEFYNRGESILFDVIIRRVFYMPSYICSQYYDFFSNHEKLWLRQDAFLIQNILQRIFEKPYPYGATRVISEQIYEGYILSPNTGMMAEAYTQIGNLYAEYIMRNAGLEEAQVGLKIPGEISITSHM